MDGRFFFRGCQRACWGIWCVRCVSGLWPHVHRRYVSFKLVMLMCDYVYGIYVIVQCFRICVCPHCFRALCRFLWVGFACSAWVVGVRGSTFS